MAAGHGLREKEIPHFPCCNRRNRRTEEKPHMRTVSGPGTFNGKLQAFAPTRFRESHYVVPPLLLVEIDGKEPAGIVLQKRVDPNDVTALQMIENGLVRHRQE